MGVRTLESALRYGRKYGIVVKTKGTHMHTRTCVVGGTGLLGSVLGWPSVLLPSPLLFPPHQ